VELNDEIRIGGEFEIDPNLLSEYAGYIQTNGVFLYASGRSALMAILMHIGRNRKKTIHIPYYICISVVAACKNAGFKIKFYELNNDFLVSLDYLSNIGFEETLMTVNYFGFVDDNPSIIDVKKLRPDIVTISDQVQSFWTYNKSVADFSFTSLRKHFSIPDGALVYCNDPAVRFDNKIQESSFYKAKLIASILKHQVLPDAVYLKFFEDGEHELDCGRKPEKASLLACYLFERIDLEGSKRRRRENYNLVYDFGLKMGLNFVFSFKEELTPLAIPILLKNRDEVRKKLIGQNIYLPIHWPQYYFNSTSKLAKKMGTNEISLVIDQRYSANDIMIQLELLTKNSKF